MTPQRAASVVGVVLDENGEQDAARQLDRLLQRPGYRRHLMETCAAMQEILLGHADAEDRAAAAGTLEAVAIKHGVTLRFRAGTLDGAGGTIVALVDARTALATPTKRRALADENRRRADADEDASESASTAPLLRLDDETCAPPTSPLVKPRKRERSCWCRG